MCVKPINKQFESPLRGWDGVAAASQQGNQGVRFFEL